jgi:hypothetical protein
MPKPYTFPTLYDEALQLSISKLKGWGYLEPPQIKRSTINWSRNDDPAGSISVLINTFSEQPYIELDYKYKEAPRKYKVYLTLIPSNLNKGKIWYFICPQTKKRCRKLYLIDGYFLHREAFKGSMYKCQTRSRDNRHLDKTFWAYLEIEPLYSELQKKHFKKTYAGKPTKKYLKLIQQIQEIENIPLSEIERALLS